VAIFNIHGYLNSEINLIPKRIKRSKNSVSKRPFFSELLIARVFRFFSIFKKFSRLKIATTIGIVFFFGA
jgi:hypothetical protein